MGLKENFRTNQVQQMALREAITLPEDTPLAKAVQLMRSKKLGCVIIVDADNKPVGTFTERALVALLTSNPQNYGTDTVGQHKDANWACVKQTDPVLAVLDAMQIKNLRFVIVVDDAGKVVALTGQKGLMEFVAEHAPKVAMVQRVGGKPYTMQREGA